jgi:hypothetical protein
MVYLAESAILVSAMKCPTENCDETLKPSSRRLYCVNCRSAMYRAASKGPGYIKQRAKTINKYAQRLLNLSDRRENR